MASRVYISRKGTERSRVLEGGAGGRIPESAVAGVDLCFLTNGVRVDAPSVKRYAVDVTVFEHDLEGSGGSSWDLDVNVLFMLLTGRVARWLWNTYALML